MRTHKAREGGGVDSRGSRVSHTHTQSFALIGHFPNFRKILLALCISLCCESPCVVQLTVLGNTLCCATPCVVHLPVLCNSLCRASPCGVQLRKITFPFLEPFLSFASPDRLLLYKFGSNFGTHEKLEEFGREIRKFSFPGGRTGLNLQTIVAREAREPRESGESTHPPS